MKRAFLFGPIVCLLGLFELHCTTVSASSTASPRVRTVGTLAEMADPDPQRFAEAIQTYENWDEKNAVPANAVLFVGSSSIRLWKSSVYFPDYPIVNRGFGGSHISDVNAFADQIVLKYRPEVIVFYAGDNDINGGKSPQRVLEDYKTFVERVWAERSNTRIIFIPIKPSRSRWNLWPDMKAVNEMVETYSKDHPRLFYADTATPMLQRGTPPPANLFIRDGLHLSKAGYDLWSEALRPVLDQAKATR